MQSYAHPDMVYKKIELNGFKWEKFSNYIHGANIEDILTELSTADYHLERNANAKIVWTDTGIKLTRYLHRKINV
jgi:DNA polymerase-3 subunit delta'